MPTGAGRASTGFPAPFVRSYLGVRERPRTGVGTVEGSALSLASLPQHIQPQLQSQPDLVARGGMSRVASFDELSSKATSTRRARGLPMLC
jgi:hypothetical protein